MFFNMIIVGIVICTLYIILSYIFRITLDVFIIMFINFVGNVIYLRWGGGGNEHIVSSIIVGGIAEAIAGFASLVLYFAFEDKVGREFGLSKAPCIEKGNLGNVDIFSRSKCPKCQRRNIEIVKCYDYDVNDDVAKEYLIKRCKDCGHYFIEGKVFCENCGTIMEGIYKTTDGGYGLYCKRDYTVDFNRDSYIKRNELSYYIEIPQWISNTRCRRVVWKNVSLIR